ncbi:ferrochelatase [Curvivirga sp.]|uniref:ferrochelatase n=1 Tax=Curvivirga sp. TaxID=2856848 RepID=UPI003B5954BE
MSDKRKIAVVFFNLGGPNSPEAVQPFLFNLFNDKAIIGAPQPIRWLIAKLISTRRAPIAQEIYKELGGSSPLLPNTEAQAAALDSYLSENLAEDIEAKTFIAMRYWHPFAAETVQKVKDWGADEIVLLPLYPQFSTTTSESSIHDWKKWAAKLGLKKPTQSICCYPTHDGFINAVSALVEASLTELAAKDIKSDIRILYTAHGLPQKVVDGGDPYQWQVEQTAKAIAERVSDTFADFKDSDWRCCYQSRVGPLEWIKPYTEDEIIQAGQDGKALVVVPIAFISEHSETLVELDIEYKELAEENGIKHYSRVATVDCHPEFIKSLGELVTEQVNMGISGKIHSQEKTKICPKKFDRCICN